MEEAEDSFVYFYSLSVGWSSFGSDVGERATGYRSPPGPYVLLPRPVPKLTLLEK